MPHLARHLALAACLTLIGSVAGAAPLKRGGKVAKAKLQHEVGSAVDRATVSDDDDAEDDATDDRAADDDADDDAADDTTDEVETVRNTRKVSRKHARAPRHEKKSGTDQVGFVEDNDRAELVDAPVEVRKKSAGLRNWHFAIGPNVWAASVDANVAVGAKGVSTAIDFFQLSRQTKYGVPVLIEARYKRFSFVGDLLYGVVAINSDPKEIGPLMVKLDAEVSSLLVDGIAGYRLFGGDDSKLTVEPRAGIRYQRTAIAGSIGLSGNGISPPEIVDAAGDMLVGARVVVRPIQRVSIAATVDQSLFGSSTSTWSAGAEASLRITSRVLLVAGWRTLTQQRAAISTVMHGPRAALQLLF